MVSLGPYQATAHLCPEGSVSSRARTGVSRGRRNPTTTPYRRRFFCRERFPDPAASVLWDFKAMRPLSLTSREPRPGERAKPQAWARNPWVGQIVTGHRQR